MRRRSRVKQAPTWPSYLVRGFGSASSAVLILAVVPFLMFFMLTRKEKWYQNLLAGALMVTVTVALLLVLRIQGALALGVVSGFLNLIPFLGVVLAALIPMAAALVQSTPASTLLIIGFALILIHLLSSNFLSPISMVHV